MRFWSHYWASGTLHSRPHCFVKLLHPLSLLPSSYLSTFWKFCWKFVHPVHYPKLHLKMEFPLIKNLNPKKWAPMGIMFQSFVMRDTLTLLASDSRQKYFCWLKGLSTDPLCSKYRESPPVGAQQLTYIPPSPHGENSHSFLFVHTKNHLVN